MKVKWQKPGMVELSFLFQMGFSQKKLRLEGLPSRKVFLSAIDFDTGKTFGWKLLSLEWTPSKSLIT